LERLFFIGLGNPGSGYKKTRHNLGYMLADILAGSKTFKKSIRCPLAFCELQEDLTVVKPLTFMNRSGEAAKCLLRETGYEAGDILVAVDDFNLPPGKIRIRPSGSSGSHNGLESVIRCLGTEKFPRLRMGIGGSHIMNKKNYVLEKFSGSEKKTVDNMLIDCRNLVHYYLKNGIGAAMNRYN